MVQMGNKGPKMRVLSLDPGSCGAKAAASCVDFDASTFFMGLQSGQQRESLNVQG
jgi:hypothetical protein